MNEHNSDTKLQDKVNFINDVSNLLKDSISEFRDRLKQKVASTAQDIFLHVRNQVEFDGLSINDNYGLQMLRYGEVVDMRSSGYEEVVAVSLIGALHKNSPLDAPVFMDSFFGKLDPEHKRKVVKELMNITNQALIFVYSHEIDPIKTREDLNGDFELRELHIVQESAYNSILAKGGFTNE